MSPLVAGILAACVGAMCAHPAADQTRVGISKPNRRRRVGARVGAYTVGGAGIAVFATAPSVVTALEVTGAFAVVGLVGWLVRQGRRRARTQRWQLTAIRVCDALASELRAGLPVAAALARVCVDEPDLAPIDRAAQLGGDVSAALLRLAEEPGGEGLRAIAAGWNVAGQSGAPLAAVLDRIGDGLRDQQNARAEVASALGPPRATARMLAALPAFGLLIGTAMGARPLAFLAETSAGRGCMFAGIALALAGVVWVERLAASAERA